MEIAPALTITINSIKLVDTKFLDKFQSLPQSLQIALVSTNTGTTVQDALNLAQLDNNYYNQIFDLVSQVLMLDLPREQFKEKLEQVIGLNQTKAQMINQIIQDKIFEPLKADLLQPQVKISQAIPSALQNPLKIKKPQNIQPTSINELLKKPETNPLSTKISPSSSQPISISTSQPKIDSSPTTPDLNSPEITEIKIERPLNKTEEFKRVSLPQVTKEKQEEIHSKLLAAIKKKEEQPKIVATMKKVIEKGKLSKSTSEIKTEKTPVPPPETPGISQVVGGENQNFNPETKSTSPQKPYIFDVKLQERKPEEEPKNPPAPKQPLPYQKYQSQKKPFGEA